MSIDGWHLTTSVFEKQMSATLEFYFRFWSRPLPVICMSFCNTLPNFVQMGAPIAEIWRHFHVSRWRPLNTSSGFVLVDVTVFRRSKSISKPNFVDISQFMAEILKNKRSLYSNSTSGFDLDLFAVICMLFCIRLPNFVQIGALTAEIWRHIHFSRWRPRPLNTTSGFVFVDVTAFTRSKSMSKPNFVQIPQLGAEI